MQNFIRADDTTRTFQFGVAAIVSVEIAKKLQKAAFIAEKSERTAEKRSGNAQSLQNQEPIVGNAL